MKSRTVVTMIVAIVLVVLVMVVSVVVTFAGWVDSAKFDTQTVAKYGYGGAQNMKIMDLTGDGQNELFVQDTHRLVILNSAGQPILEQGYTSSLVTSMGDVNGDGIEDALAFMIAPDGTRGLEIYMKGELVDQFSVSGMVDPARVALLRFESGHQIILGDDQGQLLSLDAAGNELWRSQIGSGNEVRGLDDVKVDGQTYLAAANRNGQVALFDNQGNILWQIMVNGGLRRMRAYDLNGDGASEVLLGGESGDYIVLDARSGEAIGSDRVGQPVSEIRSVELNGEPSSQEVIAGGKNGGVWAYTWDGQRLWSASVSDKVMEIAGFDVDRDGSEEVLVGDDMGEIYLFFETGERQSLLSLDVSINRIDVGNLTASRQIAVSDGSALYLYSLEMESAPALQFTPLVVGLIISAVILLAAWFIVTNPPKQKLRLAIEDQSDESLLAQRRMLKESIADVERLKASGEVSPDAYLRRLKELRSQLAANETAMRTARVAFTPETFQCPNCGGSLPLGVDRCDYCGQMVIT